MCPAEKTTYLNPDLDTVTDINNLLINNNNNIRVIIKQSEKYNFHRSKPVYMQ